MLRDPAVFTVIIPTLQRAPELWPLVDQCARHPLVHEVLVINNSDSPLFWECAKVRVLQQEANIFVNPAWNLGVREAVGRFVAIVNDDVLFDDEVFDEAARVLQRGLFGMVVPDRSCFQAGRWDKPISHRLATGRLNLVWGTFMALRRTDYRPVPDSLLIWGGDDYLYWSQRKPNAVLIRTQFRTTMGTTSSSPEFQSLRRREYEETMAIVGALYRWWHAPVKALDWLKRTRHRFSRSRILG